MPHAADETGLEPLGFALALDALGRMRRALYSSDCPRRSAVGSTRLIGVRSTWPASSKPSRARRREPKRLRRRLKLAEPFAAAFACRGG